MAESALVQDAPVIDANTAPSASAAAAQPAGNDPAWVSSYDGDVKGWLDGMGVSKLGEKDALAKIIPMYRNAEQKLGFPSDQLLRLPKDESDVDGFRAIMTKLGKPETPDGYGLTVPDGHPDAFLKTATGWFHELDIPKRQAAGLAAKWNEYVVAQQAAAEDQFIAQADKDIAAMKAEMGEDYDKNVELSRRVRRAAGLSDEEAIAVERAIGLGRAARVFAELGKAMGEHRFHGSDTGSSTFGLSVEGAKARIADLRKDTKWQESYLSGDADKKAEWTRLHKIAFPDSEG
jgi:hypothetical protein